MARCDDPCCGDFSKRISHGVDAQISYRDADEVEARGLAFDLQLLKARGLEGDDEWPVEEKSTVGVVASSPKRPWRKLVKTGMSALSALS